MKVILLILVSLSFAQVAYGNADYYAAETKACSSNAYVQNFKLNVKSALMEPTTTGRDGQPDYHVISTKEYPRPEGRVNIHINNVQFKKAFDCPGGTNSKLVVVYLNAPQNTPDAPPHGFYCLESSSYYGQRIMKLPQGTNINTITEEICAPVKNANNSAKVVTF